MINAALAKNFNYDVYFCGVENIQEIYKQISKPMVYYILWSFQLEFLTPVVNGSETRAENLIYRLIKVKFFSNLLYIILKKSW